MIFTDSIKHGIHLKSPFELPTSQEVCQSPIYRPVRTLPGKIQPTRFARDRVLHRYFAPKNRSQYLSLFDIQVRRNRR